MEIYCPVKGDGTFDETAPEWLQGKDVWSGNGDVVEHLRESGHLFFDHQFDHSYPHDWRSKTPTIFRATEQWFISVDREVKGEGRTLREMALNATDNEIEFIPIGDKAVFEACSNRVQTGVSLVNAHGGFQSQRL